MYSLLAVSFLTSLGAMIKVALVIGASAFLVRKRVFNDSHIRALTAVVVNLALPCLVFASILNNFNTSTYPHWWKYPLIGAALTFGTLALSRLVFWRDHERGFTLSAMTTFQNAGYLILPIGEVLFPAQFGIFSVILFLMLLSYMPLLWSVGKFFISHTRGTKIKLSQVFTVPFYSSLVAMFLVFTELNLYVPEIFLSSVEMVGKSCVPLATVVLGFTMGSLHVSGLPSFFDTFRVVALKLLVIPVLMIFVLKYTSISSTPLENAFWILEASSPPATALALQAIHYGGDEKLVCGILVISYLVALFTIPLFYSIVEVMI